MKMLKQVAVALTLVAALAGCASGGRGPSDEELIAGSVATFVEGLTAKNVEQIMSVVSENFSNPEASSKAALGDFLGNAIAAGYLEEVVVGQADATTEREEGSNEAYVYPLEIESLAGVATMGLTLSKEEGGWLITGMDLEM